jgi:hypothetical protein
MFNTFRLITARANPVRQAFYQKKYHLRSQKAVKLRIVCEKSAGTSHSVVINGSTLAENRMTVESPLAGLQPANVWGFFEQLTKIPRPSKHEEK